VASTLHVASYAVGFELRHSLPAQLIEHRSRDKIDTFALVADSGDLENCVAQLGYLLFYLLQCPFGLACWLLVAHHSTLAPAPLGIDHFESKSVVGVGNGDSDSDFTNGTIGLQQLVERLVVITPKGSTHRYILRHAVGEKGVALHPIDQKAFQLALTIEETETVARRERFAGVEGDAAVAIGWRCRRK